MSLGCLCQRYIPVDKRTLCEGKRTILGFISQTVNKYEYQFTNYESAIILEKSFNSSTYKRVKEVCIIKLDTKEFNRNAGIYLNIRKMKLRQKPNGDCIDSITIKYNDMKEHHCSAKNGMISLDDVKGKIKITISIDNTLPMENPDETIEFSIVATAYKECSRNFNNEHNCKAITKSCISEAYVNDTIQNCIGPDCSDEFHRCDILFYRNDNPIADNMPSIVLSAITSLIFTMFGVAIFCWIIYKIKSCSSPPITVSDWSNPSNRRMRNQQESRGRDIELPTSSFSNGANNPTAPPIEDKSDMPPAYVGSIFWLLLIALSSLGHIHAYQLSQEGSELLELLQEVIEEHPKNVIADDQQFKNLENNQIEIDFLVINKTEDEYSDKENQRKFEDLPEGMDVVTMIWYLTTFSALVGFFIVMACTENSCGRRAEVKPTENTRTSPPTPSPSYKQFAPPSYDTVMNKYKNRIFIVPMDDENGFFTPPPTTSSTTSNTSATDEILNTTLPPIILTVTNLNDDIEKIEVISVR
ncbi:unnamed protein product [Diamesa serratosioi]